MNNELGNDISLNKFSQSSNDIISYLRFTNMTFNNKSNLHYGFYKKKYYFLTKSNSNIEDIIQKKHIIKKRFGISNNQLNNNSIKGNILHSNIKTKKKEQKNEKSNDYLTDESTLYQSQNSIIEKDNFNFNKLSKKIPNLSLFQSNFDKKILTKNILQKLPNNINLKEKINDNLKNKGIIFNLKNKFHSRIQISNQIEQYNKFNVSSKKDSLINLKIIENTIILSVKFKISSNKIICFYLRRFDNLFNSMKSFCEYNHINKQLYKFLIIKVLEALNNIYRINNYLLSAREIKYLLNITNLLDL
jgi:hypothetical protein